jgi:hypothetical protein
MIQFTLNVERGGEEEDAKLWFITSDDAVQGGRLLVAATSLLEALSEVPQAISDMQAVALESTRERP